MFSIDASFSTRAGLGDALQGDFTEGGLSLEGEYEVTVGAPVAVRVTAPGLAGGVFLETVVQERRHSSGVERAALGLRLLPGQRSRFDFLRSYADAQHAGSGRGEWRYPYDRRCVLAVYGKGTARMLHAAMRDVSPHGALVTAPVVSVTNPEFSLEFEFEGATRRLAARVMWNSRDRVGLRLALDKADDRAIWQRIYAAAVQQFEGAQVHPARVTATHPVAGVDDTGRRGVRLHRP